ncbi:hypothetical protein DFH07DRAFT_785480 [Mycena maculata]|uniref:Uncharacterized protein n=1 Tax=Mycena maculata TaxID=230809 RepID=A0AAD7HBJ0_9AGAR|nr:hypothetical protein DFH07DRAFT_785480 [Mycena maculata]
MSDIELSHEQTKILALNSKFAPRPKATPVTSVTDSVDDFSCRLRLRVDKDIEDRKHNNLHQYFPGERTEKGQPVYVPKFHVPTPDAQGPPLIGKIEAALSKLSSQIEVEVLDRRSVCIRPNINAKDLDALLQLLTDHSILAVPADKNLGLCLVTAEWYHEMGLTLLENDSYEESEPNYYLLNSTLRNIVNRTKNLLPKQQFTWLSVPLNEAREKVPVLKVGPLSLRSTHCWRTHLHG